MRFPDPLKLIDKKFKQKKYTTLKKYTTVKQADFYPNNLNQKANGKYHPVMADQLQALEGTIEMSLCRCKKSKCNSQFCVYRQNGLVYTEMCDCNDCKNELKEYITE